MVTQELAPVAVNTEHPLRPSEAAAAEVWDLAASVPDPEIPVISIADLGVLRAVRLDADRPQAPTVVITPTYSGCPAMDAISADVAQQLREHGFDQAQVDVQLHPAWTTDWITQHGRDVLEDYGIAPPTGVRTHAGPVPLTLAVPVPCPHCGSRSTRELSHFGSTSCKALYVCNQCSEPFDHFKAH